MARAVLVAIFRAIIRLYFRAIERVGEPPSDDVRGRVFVANHFNALIDPVVVLTAAACPIAPIAKAPLWKIRGLAWLLDAARAVPIGRAKDEPGKAPGANDSPCGPASPSVRLHPARLTAAPPLLNSSIQSELSSSSSRSPPWFDARNSLITTADASTVM